MFVGFGKQLFDAFTGVAVDRDADAGGDGGIFGVVGHNVADAIGDALGIFFFRFGKDESEFIATVAGGGVNGAAMNAESIRDAAESAAASEMTESVVDFFEAIEIEEQDGERPLGTIGALGFVFEDVEKLAVIGEAGERIANGQMANLFEEAGVVQKSAAESDGVTENGEALREHEGSVEQAFGLGRGNLRGDIEQGGGVDGAVEGGVFLAQAAAIPYEGDEKNRGGQKLLRAGKQRTGVARRFRR